MRRLVGYFRHRAMMLGRAGHIDVKHLLLKLGCDGNNAGGMNDDPFTGLFGLKSRFNGSGVADVPLENLHIQLVERLGRVSR